MTYANLIFDEAEEAIIATAWRNGALNWSSSDLQAIRSKIRNFHRELRGDRCCYCQKHFSDDHPLAVDIEHILPKSKFTEFSIKSVNLTIACKRCNMTIKRDRVDFLHGRSIDEVKAIFDKSEAYEFIHPNLDNYENHLQLLMTSIGNNILRRYLVVDDSEKGARTVAYFDLRSLESDDLDNIQGIAGHSGSERASKIRSLLGVG